MNLYFCEKTKCGNIAVYLVEGRKEKIREYRMTKMSAIPQTKGACQFSTNNLIRLKKIMDKKQLSAESLLKSQQVINTPKRGIGLKTIENDTKVLQKIRSLKESDKYAIV